MPDLAGFFAIPGLRRRGVLFRHDGPQLANSPPDYKCAGCGTRAASPAALQIDIARCR
jgi:hypothetical protein